MSDDEIMRAWAYLATVAEPPCAGLIALAEDLGPVEAASAVRTRIVPSRHKRVLVPTEARAAVDSSAEDLDACHRIGAQLLTRDDADWPAWNLLALDQADSAARGGAPLALWVRGPASCADVTNSGIALVGSRASSSYGDYVTGTIAADLASEDWSVISGGAYGVDGAAHRGALGAHGLTAAVLACGIDRAYPSGHSQLLREIAEVGLIVSEYPPGTTAAKHRFLTRNRLSRRCRRRWSWWRLDGGRGRRTPQPGPSVWADR